VLSKHWDEPVPLLGTDLSPFGMWIHTFYPLEVGSELSVAFEPPSLAGHLFYFDARVCRANLLRREGDQGSAGMGVEFLGMRGDERDLLTHTLTGMPPRLPRGPRPRTRRRLTDRSVETLRSRRPVSSRPTQLVAAGPFLTQPKGMRSLCPLP